MTGDIGITRIHDLDLAIDQRRNIGRSAADIDGNDVALAIEFGEIVASHDPSRRAGHEDTDRSFATAFDSGHPAVRLHDAQFRIDAVITQLSREMRQIV